MKVMLGCMIESSVVITAGAQISPLVDFADLENLNNSDEFDLVLAGDVMEHIENDVKVF